MSKPANTITKEQFNLDDPAIWHEDGETIKNRFLDFICKGCNQRRMPFLSHRLVHKGSGWERYGIDG